MKSAGIRLRACVACQGRLPAGSRIDRKYCGQSCITRAYYQRHPEKKRVLASRTRRSTEAETRTPRGSGNSAKKLERLEADNATLQNQLKEAQAQIASLTAVGAPSRSQPQGSDLPQATSLIAAAHRIESLSAEFQRARDEARRAAQRSADEIAELRQQLNEPTLGANRGERPREQNQPRHSDVEQASPRPQASPEDLRRPRNESLPPSAEEWHIPQQSLVRSQPMLQPVKQSATGRVREPLPWERPAEQAGQPPIPKWKGWPAEMSEKLRTFSDETVADLPTAIYKMGERSVSAEMRDWLNDSGKFEILEELSFRIIVHTVCTDRSQRRTSSQKDELALLVLDGAIASMVIDKPIQARAIKATFDEDKGLFERLTLELLVACARKELNFNESTGRWRLS